MRLWRVLRAALALCAAAGAAWWLLADTVRKYAPAAGDQPLRVSFWGIYEEFEMWGHMLDDFRRKNVGLEVRAEYMPGGRYEQKVKQLLVADEAADVILYQDEPFWMLVDHGKFEDLTGWIERNWGPGASSREALHRRFFATAVDSFGRWEGRGAGRRWHQYGLPIWGGPNLLYCNRKCFARAGVIVGPTPDGSGLWKSPDGKRWIVDDDNWTIDQWVEVLRRLTIPGRPGQPPEQFGYNLGWWLYWLPFHYTLGAGYLDERREHTVFCTPEVLRSLKLQQDLVYRYHVCPAASELTMGQSVGFLGGRLAILNSGPWEMPFCNAAELDYDLLHIPRRSPGGFRATRITWDAVAMYRGSKKKDLAWRLMDHLVTPESQRTVTRVQRDLPSLRSEAGTFVTANPKVHTIKFVEAAEQYAVMQPITIHWEAMARVFARAVQNVLLEDPARRLTPEEAVGMVYDDNDTDAMKLMTVLPPLDANEAAKYREIYLRSGKTR